MKSSTTPESFTSLRMLELFPVSPKYISFVFAVLVGTRLFQSFVLVFPTILASRPQANTQCRGSDLQDIYSSNDLDTGKMAIISPWSQ